MTQSIELLLDDSADAAVRDQWRRLAAVGLPNQGAVASATNRPHATLLAASSIGAGSIGTGASGALAPAALRLPTACRLGGPVVFGTGAHRTLARLVVPTVELLSIHATVNRLVTPLLDDHAYPHTMPGGWTPHVTLARRLTTAQVGDALAVLDAEPLDVTFTALRLWDGNTKSESTLPGRAC